MKVVPCEWEACSESLKLQIYLKFFFPFLSFMSFIYLVHWGFFSLFGFLLSTFFFSFSLSLPFEQFLFIFINQNLVRSLYFFQKKKERKKIKIPELMNSQIPELFIYGSQAIEFFFRANNTNNGYI